MNKYTIKVLSNPKSHTREIHSPTCKDLNTGDALTFVSERAYNPDHIVLRDKPNARAYKIMRCCKKDYTYKSGLTHTQKKKLILVCALFELVTLSSIFI